MMCKHFVLTIAVLMIPMTLTGCGEFNYKTLGQKLKPSTNVFDGSTEDGTQIGASHSATRTLEAPKAAAASVRTSSSSPRFKMVSGVGVQ